MPASKSRSKKGTAARTRSTGYLHPYSHYEAEYNFGQRSIKRWVAIGRESEDPPPLDQPEMMAAWWSRHMKQRCPDRFLKLSKAVAGDGDAQVEGSPLFEKPAADPAPDPVVPFEIPDDLDQGLEASVNRLRRAEAIANLKYLHAMEHHLDAGTIELHQRSWHQLSNQLRQQEKSLRELEGKYGAMFTESEVKAMLDRIHRPISKGILNLIDRIAPKLDQVEDPAERKQLWLSEVKRLFNGFTENGFAHPVEEIAVGE